VVAPPHPGGLARAVDLDEPGQTGAAELAAKVCRQRSRRRRTDDVRPPGSNPRQVPFPEEGYRYDQIPRHRLRLPGEETVLGIHHRYPECPREQHSEEESVDVVYRHGDDHPPAISEEPGKLIDLLEEGFCGMGDDTLSADGSPGIEMDLLREVTQPGEDHLDGVPEGTGAEEAVLNAAPVEGEGLVEATGKGKTLQRVEVEAAGTDLRPRRPRRGISFFEGIAAATGEFFNKNVPHDPEDIRIGEGQLVVAHRRVSCGRGA
jgi:hypothetical protein